jgi:hypothetical protein
LGADGADHEDERPGVAHGQIEGAQRGDRAFADLAGGTGDDAVGVAVENGLLERIGDEAEGLLGPGGDAFGQDAWPVGYGTADLLGVLAPQNSGILRGLDTSGRQFWLGFRVALA